jgi:hypothetical protein
MALRPRFVGVLLVLLLHALFISAPEVLRDAGVPVPSLPWGGGPGLPAFLIGIIQIPYVAAAWALLRWRGYGEIAAGVLRGALLTLLVNAGACGALYLGLATAGF